MEGKGLTIDGREARRVTLGGAVLWEKGEYEPIERVLQNTSRRFDTGVLIDDFDYAVRCVFMPLQWKQWATVFSNYTDETSSCLRFLHGNNDGGSPYFNSCTTARFCELIPFGLTLNVKHEVVVDKNGCTYDRVRTGRTRQLEAIKRNITLKLPNSSELGQYIYEMQIWHGEQLVADLRPMRRKSDGVEGLFDLVTNTFNEGYQQ